MPFILQDAVQRSYDVVLVGTGFGSLFFVHRGLERNPRIAVRALDMKR